MTAILKYKSKTNECVNCEKVLSVDLPSACSVVAIALIVLILYPKIAALPPAAVVFKKGLAWFAKRLWKA